MFPNIWRSAFLLPPPPPSVKKKALEIGYKKSGCPRHTVFFLSIFFIFQPNSRDFARKKSTVWVVFLFFQFCRVPSGTVTNSAL